MRINTGIRGRAYGVTPAVIAFLVVAVIAVISVAGRGPVGPGASVAATPVPDTTLKQQCIDGAAVGAGNDGLASDCALLLAAKDTLRGTATLNWSASTAIADWTGITVGGTPQRVTGVTPTYQSLNGTIPAQLGGLSKLEDLQLSNNALTGSIPAELGALRELDILYLFNNELTGAIPAELGNLAKLRFLGLRDNQLTGSIPAAFATLWNLQDLYLNNNQLSGAIPAALSDLGLRSLYAAGNSGLTGCIPAALSSVSYSDLATLELDDCAAEPTHTLTISKGTGGIVDPSAGSHSYRSGALARVLATPGSAYRLASWGGDCADTARTETACVLTIDADKTASVTFERAQTLTTSAGANGSVDPPAGSHRYATGSSVTVTATADDGYQVASWGGDCAGTAATETTCTLTMGGDRTASVTFVRVYTLTTSASEHGSIEPAAGTHSYVEGTSVTVTASWNDATHDLTWAGDCAGTTVSSCELTMDADKTASATFTALAADRCATTTAADCIRAVYRGAPGDYAQVVDIPAGALLTAGADGRYRVERGQQVTVVTAAAAADGLHALLAGADSADDGSVTPQLLAADPAGGYDLHVRADGRRGRSDTDQLRPDGSQAVRAPTARRQAGARRCRGDDGVPGRLV